MVLRSIICCTAFSVMVSQSASLQAATTLVEVPVRYLLVPPMKQGEKRVGKGETVFEFPLRWQQAAMPLEQVEIRAENSAGLIQKGQTLVRTRLQFDSSEFASAISFCEPRMAAPVDDRMAGAFLGKLGMKLLRSQTDEQFCVIDRDADGQFDHSVLVNDGSPNSRTPHQITLTRYEIREAAPVGEGDKLRIRYVGKYQFQLDLVMQNVVRQFDTYSVTTPEGRLQFARQPRPSKQSDGSYTVALPGIDLLAMNYDKANGTVMVRWPAKEEPTIMPIPEDIAFGYRFGY